MESIHCIDCGGYVTKPRTVAYRAGAAHPRMAPPHERACTCPRSTLLLPVYRGAFREPVGVGSQEGQDVPRG